ncbi:MAG: VanZ family protein [Bacteroidetes bacterium]|nr:VanZ family protein [Bacteroidota bacterium]
MIMVLLSLPGSAFPRITIWAPDKLAHILLFGMQFFLLWLALELPRRKIPLRLPPLAFSALITVSFGILSEIYQDLFTTRIADIYDMIANGLGVLLTLLLLRAINPSRILAFVSRHLRLDDSPTG